jgi:hypothetical protein
MLQQKKQTKNMQIHIDNVYSFLDAHLPYSYVDDVLKLMSKKNKARLPAKSTIRKVRVRSTPAYEKRLDILNAMVDLAKKNKSEKEKLTEKIST